MAYIGNRMSERAAMAYDKGEKPLSRWTKEDIINSYPKEYQEKLSKLPLKTLKDNFLKRSSWHHTGKYFNQTDFYSPFDLDEEEDFINKRLNFIQEEVDKKKQYENDKKAFLSLSDEEKQKIYDEWTSKRFEAANKALERFPEYDTVEEESGMTWYNRPYSESQYAPYLYQDRYGNPIEELGEYKKYASAPDYFDLSKIKSYTLKKKQPFKSPTDLSADLQRR